MKDDGSVIFSHNWNNKLCCNSFTTIRRLNPEKYQEGNVHRVMMKTTGPCVKDFGFYKVQDVKELTFDQIISSEYICYLDTGYSSSEVRKILGNMYKGITGGTKFSYVLYVKV